MKRRLSTILFGVVFIAGLSLLLYPTVSDYWNSFHQSRAIASYVDAVDNTDEQKLDEMRKAAQAYNEKLLSKQDRYEMSDQDKAESAKRCGELTIVEIIEHDQRHNQRHNQPDAHQVVTHGARNAITRPAKVGDKQAIGAREGGANHDHPQQRHRGGDAIANRDRERIGPGFPQAIPQRHPQHRQRRGDKYRPKHGAQRQPEMVLSDFPHPCAGTLQETGKMPA